MTKVILKLHQKAHEAQPKQDRTPEIEIRKPIHRETNMLGDIWYSVQRMRNMSRRSHLLNNLNRITDPRPNPPNTESLLAEAMRELHRLRIENARLRGEATK